MKKVAANQRMLGFLVLAAALAIACGPTVPDSDSDGAAGAPAAAPADYCADYAPCGGRLVGRWRVTSTCSDPSFANDPSCANYSSAPSVSGTATYEFGSDGVLGYAGAITSTFDISVNDDCSQAIAHKDVDGYCQLLQDSADDNPNVPSSISCSIDGGRCDCHVVVGPIVSGHDDTYVISGKNVTITTDGAPNTHSYCVSGDTLTLAGPTGEPALVFTRN